MAKTIQIKKSEYDDITKYRIIQVEAENPDDIADGHFTSQLGKYPGCSSGGSSQNYQDYLYHGSCVYNDYDPD